MVFGGAQVERFGGTLFLRDIHKPPPPIEEEEGAIEALAEELEEMELEKIPKLKVYNYGGGLYELLPSEVRLFHALVLLRRSYFRVELVEMPKSFEKPLEKRKIIFNEVVDGARARNNQRFNPFGNAGNAPQVWNPPGLPEAIPVREEEN